MSDRVPTVTGDLDGWSELDRRSETVFRLPSASVEVEGHTVLYEDPDLTRAMREATGTNLEGPWRFAFATRLTFSPPLAPGVGPASLLPSVASETDRNFLERLRERGCENVRKRRTERVRVDTGERARLRKYVGAVDPGGADPVDVEGWTGLWVHDGAFLLAGGAHPSRGLESVLASLPADRRPGVDPSAFRNELLALIRSVE